MDGKCGELFIVMQGITNLSGLNSRRVQDDSVEKSKVANMSRMAKKMLTPKILLIPKLDGT